MAYGINYEFGFFRQKIRNGYQKEYPDNWTRGGSPLMLERSGESVVIPIYGHLDSIEDGAGKVHSVWLDWQLLIGIPHDLPVPSHNGESVGLMRLYSARSSDSFDMEIFNAGDYVRAMRQKILSESVSKLVFPPETADGTREMHLIQTYFLVACALRDITRRFQRGNGDPREFAERNAIQLNSVETTLALVELQRILVDEHRLEWGDAWEITRNTISFTWHGLLQDGLGSWPLQLLEKVLPKHLQILYEINHRFLKKMVMANAALKMPVPQRSLSVIEESGERGLNLPRLAMIGCKSISALNLTHREDLQRELNSVFRENWDGDLDVRPDGVSLHRWLKVVNPEMSDWISDAIGDQWLKDPRELENLREMAGDRSFCDGVLEIQKTQSERLTRMVEETTKIPVDPRAIIEVNIAPVAETHRLLISCLKVIDRYLSLKEDGLQPDTPWLCIYAGKAAPGHWGAKQLIKLIHNLADTINKDPRIRRHMVVAFLPDIKPALVEKIVPGSDLFESLACPSINTNTLRVRQFAINGVPTIGPWNGVNAGVSGVIGENLLYLFGDKSEAPAANVNEGWKIYRSSQRIRRVIDTLRGDLFCKGQQGLFQWIFNHLLNEGDPFGQLPLLESYFTLLDRAALDYQKRDEWASRSVQRIASAWQFSVDRVAEDYLQKVLPRAENAVISE